MFQFRRFPSYAYFVQRRMTGYCPAGLPHSEICGSKDICSSPQLIAACHVLLRLLMPRHSPCALYSLTYRIIADSQLNYAGNFTGFFEIVIVTHLYDVPQLNYTLLCLFRHRTSLLPYFTLLLHCSVFKVHCPITFAIRFEDPTFQSGLQIQQQTLFGGPEWARTTDLAIISRTL